MKQEFRFNLSGERRKQLVGAISEILNQPMKYLGAPTFAYQIGNGYHIDKTGTVTGEFNLNLFAALEQRGFEPEPSKTFHLITPRGTLLIQERFDTAEQAKAEGYGIYFHHEGRDVYVKAAPDGKTEHSKWFAVVGAPFEQEPEATPVEAPEPDRLTIEMPLDGFTPEAIDNLCKMVAAKEGLLMAALGAEALPVQVLEDRIAFPWFGLTDDAERVNAYSQLIAALCMTAKEKKRVTAKAQVGYENEKFSMRVWLIGLGCVGSEYKYLRRIMGEFLGGNSAWRYGAPEKAAPVEADNAPETAEPEATEEIPAEETAPAQAE